MLPCLPTAPYLGGLILLRAVCHDILDFSARVLAEALQHIPRVDIEGRMHTLVTACCLFEIVDWSQFAQRLTRLGLRNRSVSTQLAIATGGSHARHVRFRLVSIRSCRAFFRDIASLLKLPVTAKDGHRVSRVAEWP